MEAVARIAEAAQIDRIGTDIRSPRGSDPGLVLRSELANRIVALLQSGSNVLLTGPAGVGKTSLARSLHLGMWRRRELGQLRLVEDPRLSSPPLILETQPSRLIEGCYYAHDLENKMAKALEAVRIKPAILFLDSIDQALGMGSSSADPATDIANLLVPHLDRGLRVIAATTNEGESKLRSANPRLHSRFVVVSVPQPDEAEAASIAELHLRQLERSGASVEQGVYESGITLVQHHLPGEASAASFLRLAYRASSEQGVVSAKSMRRALASELGVLPAFVGVGPTPTYEDLAGQIEAEVFGQSEAVSEFADALVRFATGLSEPGRPIASFMLAGPSGCGKTSLALATACALSGSRDGVMRFDMSEYSDPYAPQRLLEDTESSLVGRLSTLRAGVLLFDEIEKAHPSVHRLLLQALDDARLTSASGKSVRLDGFVVVLTTNVGARRWSLGLPPAKAVNLVLSDCAEVYPPELRARLTRTVVFRPLSRSAARRVVARELYRVGDLSGLVERNLQIIWAENLLDVLCSIGVSAERGARGLQGTVRTLVVSSVARWLAEHPQASHGVVMVAPRLERGEIASLAVDWVDDSGFFTGRPN